jgi:hypothetical protein
MTDDTSFADVVAIDGEAGQGFRSASPTTKTREVLKK